MLGGWSGPDGFFQASIDALSAHVAVVAASGLIVAVNRAWLQFCEDNGGSGSDCGVGANYLAVCGDAPADLEGAPAMTRGLLAVLRGERGEFTVTYPCHAPHEQRWFRARITPVRLKEQITHAVVAHENITERELSLLALRESEARFQILTDLTPVGIVMGDMTGALEYVNQAYLRLVGHTREEFGAGLVNWLALTPPEWRRSDEVAAREVERCGLSAPYEKEYLLRDGRRVPVLLGLARYRSGERERLCGYVLDLTERKRAEEDLRELNTRLEALVEERTDELMDLNVELRSYADAVSRDLRPPVTRILGFTKLLHHRLKDRLDAPEERSFTHLRAESERVSGLLGDLHAFAGASRPQWAAASVPLGLLVTQVRSDLEPVSRGRRVEWRVGELPTVTGDALRLRHALTQLLHNALKFTREEDTAVIEVGARLKGSEAVLWVRDNGVGFAQEDSGKLFRVFSRLHGSAYEGAGVGLANVRRIAQAHGGRVWAESSRGRGATFFLALPHTPPEEPGA